MITRSKLSGLFNEFFSSEHFFVVGASSDPSKYGNKVLKWYMNNNYPVTAVNPNEKIVEGLKTIPNLSSFSSNIPPSKISVSIITPPKITKTILEEAAKELQKFGYNLVQKIWTAKLLL
nr:2352_t:CDS:2 [Entrophospora candida]